MAYWVTLNALSGTVPGTWEMEDGSPGYPSSESQTKAVLWLTAHVWV